MGYNRQVIYSCSGGVISPTRKLKAQFVHVDKDTPLARIVNGMISGGYSHGIGPQLDELSEELPALALIIRTCSQMLHCR